MKDEALLDALLEVRGLVADGRQDSCGICCQLPILDQAPAQLKGLFRRWSEFSGNEAYPVPHPTNNPRSAYYGYSKFRSKEDAREYSWGNNPYGQARRRLLDFCIAELQRELSPSVTSKTHRPTQGGHHTPGMFEPVYPYRGYTGTDANYEATKATTPATCCPCGQVPVCHGLRSCGKSSA